MTGRDVETPTIDAVVALLDRGDREGALVAIDRELGIPLDQRGTEFSSAVRDSVRSLSRRDPAPELREIVAGILAYTSNPSDIQPLLGARDALGALTGRKTCVMCKGTHVHPFHPASGETYWGRCPACVGTGWEN